MFYATALINAIMNDHIEITQELLSKKGIDVNIKLI